MNARVSILASLWLAALAAVTGCASSPAAPDETTLQINKILDPISSYYAEEGARRCLPTSGYRSVKIIDERRLVFRGSGDKAWLNELRSKCSGLRRDDTLLFEQHSSRLCATDRISVIDRFMFWSRSGPTCFLGEFKPIPPSQIQQIDELLHGD